MNKKEKIEYQRMLNNLKKYSTIIGTIDIEITEQLYFMNIKKISYKAVKRNFDLTIEFLKEKIKELNKLINM